MNIVGSDPTMCTTLLLFRKIGIRSKPCSLYFIRPEGGIEGRRNEYQERITERRGETRYFTRKREGIRVKILEITRKTIDWD